MAHGTPSIILWYPEEEDRPESIVKTIPLLVYWQFTFTEQRQAWWLATGLVQ